MSLRDEILHRFEFLTYFFNPDAVGAPAVIQFQIDDAALDAPVRLYLEYDLERCRIFEGTAPSWNTFIDVQYAFWRELQGRQIGALQMIKELHLKENIRVSGEFGVFMRLSKIFAGTLNGEHFRPPNVVKPFSRPPQAGWRPPKRILVLSGSGRSKSHASSYHFAAKFAEGLSRGAPSAVIELVHLRDYDIRPCRGCFSCWRNGGNCVVKDDFEAVVRTRLDACDLLVFAYPIYFYDFPPELRAVITRMFVFDHPQLYWNDEIQDVAHYHRGGYGFSLFLLSTGAAFDRTQIAIPVTQAKLLEKRHNVPYLGCIFRQTGVGFITPAARTALHEKIEGALAQAGCELAREGHVTSRTLQQVERDVVTPAQLRAGARGYQDWLEKKFKFPFTAPKVEVSPFDIEIQNVPLRSTVAEGA